MRIKMLQNRLGSPDGVSTKHYNAGEEYTVPEKLGAAFVAEKVAEEVAGEGEIGGMKLAPDGAETGSEEDETGENPGEGAGGEKSAEGAEENKALKGAPENKARGRKH